MANIEDMKSYEEVVAYFNKVTIGLLHRRVCWWVDNLRITIYKTKAIVSDGDRKITYYPDGRIVVKKVPRLRENKWNKKWLKK